ncbi:MAG TPA: hypothetical protein VMU50_15645 [Polyangia bacterium]|nr:hypothetical protein [Polyangia bacterium]
MLALGAACNNEGKSDHQVYFVGYVYDGATGQRLGAKDITAVSIKYRDQVIHTKIDDDGRFVSVDALPTWQDYTVYVAAPGYRDFVSNNPGFDVPKSLQMTDGVASADTVQTFHFDAHLFPTDLKAPKVTLTILQSDALVAVPPPDPASGTLRLQPVSLSALDSTRLNTDVHNWANDEDLLNQTVTLPFSAGVAEIPEGQLVYGVSYQLSIFDVAGYQPLVGMTAPSLTAGFVTSMQVTIQVDIKAPLRILATDADKCTPPLPSANAYAAAITLTFTEEIEASSPTFAEDIDSGVSVSPSSSSSIYCGLNTSADPTKQERGTHASISGKALTLTFNPTVGLAMISIYGSTCMLPPALTSVSYGNLGNVFVQPTGDAVRKRSIGAMLAELPTSSSFGTVSTLSCGRSQSSF